MTAIFVISLEIALKDAKMTKSKKMSKTHQKYDLGMEPSCHMLLDHYSASEGGILFLS